MNLPQVPKSLRRRAVEAQGWLELGCAEYTLTKLEPLLESPGARPYGLKLKTLACVDLKRFADAVETLRELDTFETDRAWFDLTEAWCHKRLGDLDAAVACMERLVARERRSAIGHFNLGCYLALRGDLERALDEVSIACGNDDQFRTLLDDEKDLDAIRDDPEFQALRPRGNRK